jgi:putative glutamine amidotransferase
MAVPLIAIAGRISPEATNVRGPAYAGGQGYANAVARAGGQAVIIPPTGIGLDRTVQALSRFQGVVLHGGGDINPARYGQAPTEQSLYGIIDEHDELEFAVLAAALALDLPVLAICRGHQVLNVHCGGTLMQDIGTEKHWHTHHPVSIEDGSRLAAAVGNRSVVDACHSVHHQAIDRLGDGLRVTAMSDDGFIEGIELVDSRWAVGVQWHPEDTAATDTVHQALFNAFVAEAIRL